MCSKTNSDALFNTTAFKEGSFWPLDIQCGLGMSTGECVSGECVCSKGFQHDLSYVRFRNCSMPTLFLPIVFGVHLFALLFIIPYVFMKYREAKSIARTSLLSTFIASLFYLLFCVGFITYKFIFNIFLFFILYLMVFAFSIANGITVYSLVAPLSAVAGKSKEPLMNTIIATLVFFRISGLVPIVIASIWFYNPNDPTNDKGWSNLANVFSFLVALESVSMATLFIVFGTKMVKLLEEIKNPQISLQSTLSRAYMNKVKQLIFRNKVALAPLLVVLCVVPVVQFAAGSVPFNFVFLGFSLSNIPLLIFIIARYTALYGGKQVQARTL